MALPAPVAASSPQASQPYLSTSSQQPAHPASGLCAHPKATAPILLRAVLLAPGKAQSDHKFKLGEREHTPLWTPAAAIAVATAPFAVATAFH